MPDATLGPKAQIMVDLAARREGVTIPEAAAAIHEAVPNASARLGGLVRRGYLVRLRRWRATRYFASQELAKAFAEAEANAQSPDAPRGHSRRDGVMGERTRYLLALTARPQGVGSAEVAARFGLDPQRGSNMLVRQLLKGRLRVDKSGGYHRAVYHAIDPAAWSDFEVPVHAPAAAPAAAKPARRAPPTAAQKFRVVDERPGLAPPVRINGQPDRTPSGDELVMAPDAKITRAPGWTHDPRYQAAPGERPFGAGFGAVGIGRDVRTGQAWWGRD